MIFQCYYNNHLKEGRCENDSTEELEYWCSEEHKSLWQKQNYDHRKGNISIEYLQKKLLELGKATR